MTKKKDPSEYKKRGKPEEVIDNSDLRSALAGVKHLNQLTAKAHQIIKDSILNVKRQGQRRGFVTKNILVMLTMIGEIKRDNVKKLLDESELFDGDDYQRTSVDDYKRVLKNASIKLTEMINSNDPIRVDLPTGECTKFNGHEMYELQKLLNSNPDKEAFLALAMKICGTK